MSDQDHLLEHNYDGIQEYDNPLPGWWVYLFIGSIIFSVLYYPFYHWGAGPSIHDEFNAEAAEAFELQSARFAQMTITEELLYKQQLDGTLMNGMALKFKTKCASCHADDGGGLACPNLTDDYWLHGGDLVSIFETIRDGIPGKEMKSWADELGPAGCVGLAAYVGTLRGRNVPGGKAKEGTFVQYTPPDLTAAVPVAVEKQPEQQ
ncbi:MAG: cbb3-type cytochrome c oxidase N-terminal domain-containing protein [Planctomycetota bacterium]